MVENENFLSYLNTRSPALAHETRPYIVRARTILSDMPWISPPQKRDFLLTVINHEAKNIVPEAPYNLTMVDYVLAHRTVFQNKWIWEQFQHILHPTPQEEKVWKRLSVSKRLALLQQQAFEEEEEYEVSMLVARELYNKREKPPEIIPSYRRRPIALNIYKGRVDITPNSYPAVQPAF